MISKPLDFDESILRFIRNNFLGRTPEHCSGSCLFLILQQDRDRELFCAPEQYVIIIPAAKITESH
jgi:hypothetical protein